jgi:RNA polymerase subunit RPABC4/transcription elongation factor Spt4
MEFKTDEANLCADSNQVGEIDLYGELITFTDLAPEDRSRHSAPRPVNDSEPAWDATVGFVFADADASNEATVEPVNERENQSPEPMNQTSFELVDQEESRPAEEPSGNPTDADNPIEDFPFELPYEPASVTKRESSFEHPRANESNQRSDVDLDLAYLLRVTGPLIALGLAMNGDSSLLVCKDCRSQSSSKDMFCVTCGGLLEGTGVAEDAVDETKVYEAAVEAAGLACDDCAYLIEEGEIFCPSCGAAT